MSEKYCQVCGSKLVDKELEGEGLVPFCPACNEFRFPMYNVAVSMIVINKKTDKILLIKQYGRDVYILVAGYVNRGEQLEHAVVRELKEETGLDANDWLHLCDTFTTPGFSNEKISLYLARDLIKGESRPDEDEFLNLIKMPFEEAFNMVMHGEIRDAKTQIAISMAKHII